MGKVVDLTATASKEERLKNIVGSLDEIKDALVAVIDAYEAEDENSDKLDLLTEALDALEDAYEIVCEIVEDEK